MTAAWLLPDEQGRLPLPWLETPLDEALTTHRGHALLVHASPGLGALPYALSLAQAWLCEQAASDGPHPGRACGHCGSCKLMRTHLHPDLLVLMPETLRREHEWPLVGDKAEGDDSKRKPSRQIRIDEVRSLIDWSQKTTSRGQGKVAVLHPADALNVQSANALLKTLEEPPVGTRLILTCADPAALLPTVRSRCQKQALPPPSAEAATQWLKAQGLANPAVLLNACSGRPLDALQLAQDGIDANAWAALPGAVAAARASAFSGWPVPRMLDALHKLCHDAMARAAGASPRFFPANSFPSRPSDAAAMGRLSNWLEELDRVARHEDHAWSEALLVESLVQQGAAALRAPLPVAPPAQPRSGTRRFDTLNP